MTEPIFCGVMAISLRFYSTKTPSIIDDDSGATGVEFALVAFPFIMLVIGIFALGVSLYATLSLDYATQHAARTIMTGQSVSNPLTNVTFRTSVLCPLLPAAIFDCNSVVINLRSFSTTPGVYNSNNYYQFVNSSLSGLIQPPLDNTKTSFCAGLGNNYEVLEVLYPLPIYFSMLATSAQVSANHAVIMSSVTFKNEPFPGGTVAPGC